MSEILELKSLNNEEFTERILSWELDAFITEENIDILEIEVYQRISNESFKPLEDIYDIPGKKKYTSYKLNKIHKLLKVAEKLEQIRKSFIVANNISETGIQILKKLGKLEKLDLMKLWRNGRKNF